MPNPKIDLRVGLSRSEGEKIVGVKLTRMNNDFAPARPTPSALEYWLEAVLSIESKGVRKIGGDIRLDG